MSDTSPASFRIFLDALHITMNLLNDAGIRSIALDSSSWQPAGSWSHTTLELLKSWGFRCYLEPWPRNTCTHWHNYPWMSLESGAHPGYDRAALSDLTEERIVLFPQSDATSVANMHTRISHGWTVCAGLTPALVKELL